MYLGQWWRSVFEPREISVGAHPTAMLSSRIIDVRCKHIKPDERQAMLERFRRVRREASTSRGAGAHRDAPGAGQMTRRRSRAK